MPIESFDKRDWLNLFSEDSNKVGICVLCPSTQLHATASPRWCQVSTNCGWSQSATTCESPYTPNSAQYFSLLCTTKYYSVLGGTTPVLLQHYPLLQGATPVLLSTVKRQSRLSFHVFVAVPMGRAFFRCRLFWAPRILNASFESTLEIGDRIWWM